MYNKEEIPETPFMKIKCGLKLSLINLFSIQFIFYTLALVFIELSSHFQLSSKYGFTNPRELSAFAFDMWFIAFIFSACLFVGVFINKIKRIPLYFLLLPSLGLWGLVAHSYIVGSLMLFIMLWYFHHSDIGIKMRMRDIFTFGAPESVPIFIQA